MTAKIFRWGRQEALMAPWGEVQDMIAALAAARREAEED